jgi:hypothetical protein
LPVTIRNFKRNAANRTYFRYFFHLRIIS